MLACIPLVVNMNITIITYGLGINERITIPITYIIITGG